MKKILFILLLFLNFSISYSIDLESLSEATEEVEKVQEELKNLSKSDSDIANSIDSAVEQINIATEFVKKSLEENNVDSAIKTLEFIEKSLGDVANIVPQELTSDMTKVDMTQFDQDKLDTVMSITKNMNENKEQKLNELVSNMVEMQGEGLEVQEITSNLKKLGIDTIEIGVDLEKVNEMSKWSKEQWAESYEGSVITNAGTEVIVDKEIDNKILELENKLSQNNLKLIETRDNIQGLENELTPLNSQIVSLSEKKKNLLDQYNSELLKQDLSGITDEEIANSKALSDGLTVEISNLNNQINQIENQSANIKQQVASLNTELSNEIAVSNDINSKISQLNQQIQNNQNLLRSKQAELEQIKNSSPNITSVNNELNERLQKASLERDFIQTQFERSIDKEVEHFQIYANVFSDDMSEEEIDFAFKEVGALLSGDPRKTRAFDIEKYGTFAGLSQSEIQSGVNAALNDDWGTQKKVVKNIYSKLSKNPNWVVDVPSDAGLNVLIAEEQAIQEAVFVMEQSRKVQAEVDKIINQRTAQYQDFASIDPSKVSLAFTRVGIDGNLSNAVVGGTKEGKLVSDQLNEILKNNQEFIQIENSLKDKNDLYAKIVEENKNYIQMIDQFNLEQSKINNEIWEINGEVQKVNFEKNKFLQSINENDPTVWGGLALINRGQGLPDHSKWVATVKEFDQKIGQLNSLSTLKSTEAWNKVTEQNIAMSEFKTSGDQWTVMNEINNLKGQSFKIQSEAAGVARNNVINLQKNAVEEVNKIRAEEIAKTNGLYNTEEAVFNVLNKIPTFDEAQRKRAKEVISGGYYRTTGAQIVGFDDKAAGLIAALDTDANTYDAFKAAVDNVKKIGKTPVIDSHHYEMTNVKLAAIVHSRLNGNYDYMNFGESDKLQLSTADRARLEQELSKLYGSNNPKLNVLNTEIDQLNNQININSSKLANVNQDISKLESEINSLQTSENEINNQLNQLTSELNVKQSLISEKKNSLTALQSELDPISGKINELENQRAGLNEKLDQQINVIAEQLKNQGQSSADTESIKSKFESEIAAIDSQLNEFKNQSDKITTNISSLSNDLQVLEVETPEIAGQITKLNADLQNAIDIKADLAISEARKANIEIEEKIIGSIAKLDNKSIIKIEGTNSLRVVDTNLLTDEAGKFKLPEGTMTVNGNIFTAGAVQPERLLSFEAIDQTGDLKVSYSKAALEQISNTGKLAGGTQTYSGSTLGSWVLIDAKTGKQMKNPLDGHQGSIVCEASTCGPQGSFGKRAASFGGMYVLESLADPETGNVAGRCAGGNCEFNFSQNVVSGIATNVSQTTTNNAANITQSVELSEAAKANIEAAREITEANANVAKNIITNTSEVSTNVIDKLNTIASLGLGNNDGGIGICISGDNCGLSRLQITIKEINKSQAAAAEMIASGVGSTITNSLSTQTAADALAGQMARDMVQGASNEVNSTSQQLREAQEAVSNATAQVSQAAAQAASATTEASRAAAEAAQAAAQVAQAAAQAQADAASAAQAAAQEALQAAQQATQEIQQAARDAQEAAGDVVAGISGNDLEALSQLANDALGIWQEVDAQGRAVNNQQIVCEASMCGAEGAFGKAAASRGNSYVRTNRTGGY